MIPDISILKEPTFNPYNVIYYFLLIPAGVGLITAAIKTKYDSIKPNQQPPQKKGLLKKL